MSVTCTDLAVVLSAGGKEGLKDSVWLRAATGGIVCSNSQHELAVTVNATSDTASQRCSYKLLTADPSR